MSTPTHAPAAAPVVVGYDDSVDSDLAITWADRIATAEQRPLHVVIAEIEMTDVLDITTTSYEQRLAQVEKAARERVAGSHAPEVAVEVMQASPAPALIEASQSAHLVVLGAQGHNALYGLLIGSVSQHVARHAACSVLVTRQPRDPDTDRVVVGVDGSEHGARALEVAVGHAARYGGVVTAVYVVAPGALTAGPALFGVAGDHLAALREEGRRLVGDQVAKLEQSYPDVEVSVEVVFGAPGRVLADASKAAAMVVVGPRGRGEFAGMLLGSVSSAVLHHAQCPVTIIR